MKNIEEQIWDYVSGTCSPKEKKELEILLEKDPACRILLEEIQALHLQLTELDLEEPSMGFQHKIMEQIKGKPIASLNTLADKRIIYGIAGFFIISILGLLAWAFYLSDWTTSSFKLQMPKINLGIYFNRPFLYAFMFLDMILGLYFLDYFIRKNRNVI